MKSLDVCERLHTCKHVNKINQVGNIAESHKSSSRDLKPTPCGRRSGRNPKQRSINPSISLGSELTRDRGQKQQISGQCNIAQKLRITVLD